MHPATEYAFCLILLILVIYFIYSSKKEFMLPKDMSDTDINAMIAAIERSIATKQLFGDFRRMYPYELTPWQFFKLINLRKKGKLTIPVVKHILGTTGTVLPS